MNAHILNPSNPNWNTQLDDLFVQLGAPNNPTLFPPHFTKVVLPKIGGKIAVVKQDETNLGVGFCFPRPMQNKKNIYTFRFHSIQDNKIHSHTIQETSALATNCLKIEAVTKITQTQLSSILQKDVELILYNPEHQQRTYAPTEQSVGGINIGQPNQAEASAARIAQKAIWGSSDQFLYPTDLYSPDFVPGTALVARIEDQLAGFLFGFYKYDGTPLPLDWAEQFSGHLRIESQAMGVLPEYRGRRVGFLLKLMQAEQTRREGIGIINWTVDPLQFANAVLNFGLLRGIVFHHETNLYPFHNKLNQVPASRFEITWLIASKRVPLLSNTSMGSIKRTIVDLAKRTDVERIPFDWHGAPELVDGTYVAIEIPADWTALQRSDLQTALKWRTNTDRIFQSLLGIEPGKYVITDVAWDGSRRYLFAERVSKSLWERLSYNHII
ncbi:hypothetical protein KFU94_23130 [Chloroflexi bacterium TSY]|nr:hypothetical protein [Chloroflexi bacterium TSY]